MIKIKIEEWKDVPGHEGSYQVSNKGRVRSLDRYVPACNNSERFSEGRILSQQVEGKGYYQVRLCLNGDKGKYFKVHRLVLMAFVGVSDLQCNHKDCDKSNNYLENLEWCTQSENMMHAYENGLITPSHVKGEDHGGSKLTESDVRRIRKLLDSDIPQKEIASLFGIKQQQVSKINTGKRWGWLQ